MKFDCGETRAEKIARLEVWHPYFTIFPRRVADHDCRWLETIERRGRHSCNGYGDSWWSWEYRAKEQK